MSESVAGRIPLADMISSLHAELDAARSRAPETSPLLVKEIDLEVSFTFTKEATGGGGVKFWVYEASAAGKLATEHVQKVTLRLGPKEGASMEVGRTVGKRPS